ncbi:MAG: DUF1080 domain-containing protein [Planctomycetota bacterium]
MVQLTMNRVSVSFPVSKLRAAPCLAVLLLVVAAQFLWAPATSANDAKAEERPKLEEGFEWLFDGKTLKGWEGNDKYFRVEKGCVVAGTLKDKIPNNEFLCTEKKYEDFELILEAKVRGQGNNAGVQFRSERIPNDHEVKGYQCDIGVAFKRPVWGALYDESRRRKMLAEGPADKVKEWFKDGQWNELKIVATGDSVKLYLNGNITVDYTEEDKDIGKSGIIGLQIHSGPPTEALYRNIRIREL